MRSAPLLLVASFLLLLILAEGAGGTAKKPKGSAVYRKKQAELKQKEEDAVVVALRHGRGGRRGQAGFEVLRRVVNEDDDGGGDVKATAKLQAGQKNMGVAVGVGHNKKDIAPEPEIRNPQGHYTVGDYLVKNAAGDWVAQVRTFPSPFGCAGGQLLLADQGHELTLSQFAVQRTGVNKTMFWTRQSDLQSDLQSI